MISHSKPNITTTDLARVNDVLAGGNISNGRQVAQFEQALSDFLHTPFVHTVASGSVAIEIALKALGVGLRDEVILPTYVCKDVLTAVERCGATPILCDIGLDWRMTPIFVEPLISPATKAIIIVHIFGLVTNVEAFRQYNIPLVEDACQSFGSATDARLSGTVADIGVFSFHATKMLTTGEGGAVATHSQALSDKVTALSEAYRMSDLSAALGVSQLAHFDSALTFRRQLAREYAQVLQHKSVRLPTVRNDECLFRFVFQSEGGVFEELQQAFAQRGIAIRQGVDALLHRITSMDSQAFKNAESLYRSTVSIPFYPALTQAEIESVKCAMEDLIE
ncbi:DegT/DnrJ/EryC1/StrS family aminotransferase [Alteromonas flava]|uniref:DegT/DnrJ/EryC1/StrS family aminotransferase n=1 Tax=Alteromonas flava TaxID=2048003 RepID=UPI000C289A5E|nr:DegT/DnrJ/EryC1/StrS family aminotransferase [Alteromonas flava]